MRIFPSILMIFFCSISVAQQIDIEIFATGFTNPINIKNAGDSRLFVLEQAGVIQILNSNGIKNSTPFLNISTRVLGGGERGLLGLAFHPDYANNGYFYLNYTDNNGDTVISRFTRSSENADIADDTSELPLLNYTQPYPNHNGGDMAFGPDGYLYISSGDGGSGGDPQNRAQDLTTLLGKILRIDVDGNSNGNYGIPADNPFAESTSNIREIWAYGLRNPWKFSFDKSSGDLWIADVGQNVREEINMVSSTAAGLNYGWRCYEGDTSFDQSSNCPPSSDLTFPIAQYTHNGNGESKCSITGGYRYRGTAFPNFDGIYFFADYCSNEIGMLQQTGGDWNMTFSQVFSGNGWTTFGEGFDGELYIAGNTSDTVYKIVDPTLSVVEADTFVVKLYPNPTNNEVTLDNLNTTMVIQSVTIYSVQGKLISSISNFKTPSITISTKELNSGLYFVEITNTEGRRTIQKLIKN